MKIRELFEVESRPAIEKWCRDQTQQCYLGDHTALARVLGNFLMYVDTRDLSLAPHLLMNGFWEMWVTQAIVNYVKPGMRCIDVGANFGYYTLLLAELAGDKGFVQAYEPQPRLTALLKNTLTVNGMHQAQVSTMIVSNAPGVRDFYCNETLRGNASVRPGRHLDERSAILPMISIDEDGFGYDDTPAVDFVKIDVEGHEIDVLMGMRRVIARSKKIAIAMEFTPSDHEDPAGAIETILNLGLSLRTIGTDGIIRAVSARDAAIPDTGTHRMLWLSKD